MNFRFSGFPYKFLAGLLAIAAVSTFFYFSIFPSYYSPKENHLLSIKESSTGGKEFENSATLTKEKDLNQIHPEIIVYITGAVKSPGVYYLPPNSRVYNLIQAAGGETSTALLEVLNLAAPLSDGDHIIIYEKTDDWSMKDYYDFNSHHHSRASENIQEKININIADAVLLETLPGIGPVRADNIISFRDTTGSFTQIEDIKSVPGIGDGIFNQIKDLICVK